MSDSKYDLRSGRRQVSRHHNPSVECDFVTKAAKKFTTKTAYRPNMNIVEFSDTISDVEVSPGEEPAVFADHVSGRKRKSSKRKKSGQSKLEKKVEKRVPEKDSDDFNEPGSSSQSYCQT